MDGRSVRAEGAVGAEDEGKAGDNIHPKMSYLVQEGNSTKQGHDGGKASNAGNPSF